MRDTNRLLKALVWKDQAWDHIFLEDSGRQTETDITKFCRENKAGRKGTLTNPNNPSPSLGQPQPWLLALPS